MGQNAFALMDWRSALLLGRVSNLPTVWSNVLAGCLLAGGLPEAAPLALLLLAASLFYLGGMYLNDAFDRRIDAQERPNRPIPSGRATAATVFALGFAMLAAAVLMAAPAGTNALSAALALTAAILFYDIRHKQNPFSPLVMGLCRALLYLLAGLTVAPAPSPLLLLAGLSLLAYVAGLTYAARQENLAEFKGSWPLALLAAPLLSALAVCRIEAWPFIFLLAAWIGHALSRLLVPRLCNVKAAVGAMIAGISLLDAIWIAHAAGPGPALAALAAFGLTLAAQRKVPGT